ncbi:uncharacterized protein [Danio rerio]|uniref:Integrase catalytic domain-containing protein n=1 Tax=Danio rerio TaxID=7955 RepID=A0A8M3B0H8_DANRE|nr:uncharacterized protein LOC103910115 [Danio rerio]XP_021326966.1 uncharacterized protein LOC103910115 [Danio rerio]|eukprot:XP_009297071.1 uncharacterized protein LOC103910115 [Danio rerio]
MEAVHAEEAMEDTHSTHEEAHAVKQADEMSLPTVEISNPVVQQVRSSTRERSFTERGLEMREQEAKRQEKAFHKAYNSWKETAKDCRSTLKMFCSRENLEQIQQDIQNQCNLVHQHYEPILRNHATSPDIVNRMDACAALTAEIIDLVSKRLETIGEDYNEELVKERVRQVLNKDEYGSIFGCTKTNTVMSESSLGSGNQSKTSSKISSKRAEAEAELAAKQEQAKAMQEIHDQQAKLNKMESEWKLSEAKMLAEIKQREVEMQLKLEEERKRLHQLQVDKEVKVAAACVKVYNDLEGITQCGDKEIDSSIHRFQLNPEAELFLPQQTFKAEHEAQPSQNNVSLAQAIADSLSTHRLPVPEPMIFAGDPLKFIDWKMSFIALIERKPLPPGEKMFYLKKYLVGEARKAVEGYFYRNSEDAYHGAWKVLQDRYGNSFILQKAFRDKLMRWPKIGINDPLALRDFTDFLQGCAEAMPHIKGLSILNDCEENYKLLKKLPEWVVHKWNRIVTEELDASGDYPSFKCFTEFLQKETRIACNPITSPFMNMKNSDEKFPKRAKALSTKTDVKEFSSKGLNTSSVKSKVSCIVCKDENHSIVQCSAFGEKTIEDKKNFIQENQLCYGCLRKGHIVKKCRRRHKCGTCGRNHPTCLHEERHMVSPKPLNKTSTEVQASQEVQKVMAHALTQSSSATSSIVPVLISTVEEPQREVLTYALLDTQSDSTFILEDLLDDLNAVKQPVQLRLSTMTAVDTITASNRVCGLQVRGLQAANSIQLRQAYTRDFIPVDKSYIPTKSTALEWPHLKHLANQLPPLQNCEVGLLIGYDCPSALAPLEVIIGHENEPFAQRTELGWSIIGLSNPHLDRQGNQSFVHRVAVKEIFVPSPNDVLKILESDFNEKGYEDKSVSQEDVRFIQHLSTNIKQKDNGHYELPLPFKSISQPSLPNNRRLAVARLQQLKKKLKSNKQYSDDYKVFMKEVIDKGDAELAPEISEGETVWYIPHHGVYHPQKPGKLRVVFDCSAKFSGISLNDTLLTGPDLINSLVGVLCRFRKELVAVTCDIEKMFHQFLVPPDERNYLRFLWWEDGDWEKEPQDYRMTVHLFGATSSPGCANFGLKYLAQQYEVKHPTASEFVKRNFYVDDGLASVRSIDEAKELITDAQALCKQGGLRLHKFNSNKEDVLCCIDPSERDIVSKPLNLNPEATPTGRVLGVQWSTRDDNFQFNINYKDQPSTRRGILSVISSLFDPIGFVAPFILQGKCILQELCRKNIGWDDQLPEDMYSRWEDWKGGLQRLKEVVIPRCYHPDTFNEIIETELHHFSDASNIGYGACSYLRFKNDKGKVHCSLVMAKARVAPTKVTSIPRLELAAAVLSAKISVMLKTELEMKIDREFFWTDSQVVLAYINNEARRFHVFVANRVQLIRDITDPSLWYYINTLENPADHASRGFHASDIATSTWLRGPKFLWEQEVNPTPHTSANLLVGDPEVKPVQTFVTTVSDSSDILSRFRRFSCWSMLLKVVARIKRLGLKQKCSTDHITVEERQRAAEVVIKLMQQEAFSKEMRMIENGIALPNSSALYQLDPVLDKGLLRVGGRLKKSSLSQDLKHPVILPRDSYITKLILSHYHAKICYQGRTQTQMQLRMNGFWVIGGSKSVAKLIHKCVQCRRLRRPTEEQRMAELPKERVEVSAPFTFCGMDCFGPFVVKRARKEYKRYGLIFTCLSSRAVHIEMIEDLSTDAFINALRCFISLRGAVCKLYCDQGTNFVGARNEFKDCLKQVDIKTLEVFLAEKQCEFAFNAPSASHTGGVWERQIRTVRSVLNATIALCPGRLDDASLRTLFYEAMAIVNSRPLTVDGINDPNSLEPLTPNHLILMKSDVALPPPGKFVKEDMYATKRWRRVQYLVEQFWSRWKKEYLLNISTRQKWHTPRRNLRVNDVVIIKEDMLPRSQWQLGRVVETVKESDGFVRRVKVRVAERKLTNKRNQTPKLSIIERPIQKLVVLLEED